jgi:glutamate carboxypeptidase
MKGGWVVLLWALRALTDEGWDGFERITVFMTSDEELGSPTGRPWIEREAQQADWCLVMEPAREDGSLVIQRGMVGAVYLEVHGKTAHATASERGASAIEEVAHKILALHQLTDRERGVLVSVGTVHGGSARQVVPDWAEISVDVRAPTAQLATEVMARIQAIAEHWHVPGTKTVLRGGLTRPAFEPNAGTSQLLELARRCGAELGLDLRGSATRAGSDGNFAAALGVPTLDGLGPEGGNVCSREEFVVVESLPRRAALLAGILSGLPDLLR